MKGGETGHLCLVSELRENAFPHSVWYWLLICHIQPLLCWSMSPLYLICGGFYLIKCFLYICWEDHIFVISISMIYDFYWLWMLNHLCVPIINSISLWDMIFLMWLWIIVLICCWDSASMFIKDIGLQFSFHVVSCWVLVLKWCWPQKEFGTLPSFSTFGIVWKVSSCFNVL